MSDYSDVYDHTRIKAKKTPLVYTLPIELTNGNDGRGSKWFSSARVRQDIEATLRGMGLERVPFLVPVNIYITRVLGRKQRLWDADSLLRGNSKELIDALVAVGWFYDDGPKYVRNVIASQNQLRRADGPCVVVEVEAANG